MFLATTGLSQFWNKKEELLLLGSWCLREENRQEWEGLRYQILSSPWNNRERFYEAASYLEESTERLLELLSDYLNAVHGTSFSRRYWRILMGPWLMHLSHAFYDRYIHVKEALGVCPQATTILLAPDSFRTPYDTQETVERTTESDFFNLQLFSQISMGLSRPFPTQPYEEKGDTDSAGHDKPKGFSMKALLREGFLGLEEKLFLLLARRGCSVLSDPTLSRPALWRLMQMARGEVVPFCMRNGKISVPRAVKDERRQGLGELPWKDEFEKLFVKSLPVNFPFLYLEAWQEARETFLRRSPSGPALVASTVGWHFNEPFKFYAAHAQEQGSRLVAIQHGGGYGIYRFIPMEQHEVQVSDAYWVWGWADPNKKQFRNVPSPSLSILSKHLHSRPRPHAGNKILFVATTNPSYLYRFYSAPQGSQLEDYCAWQVRFLEGLSDATRRQLLFRPHLHSFGPAIRKRIRSRFSDIQMDGRMPLHESLMKSRLVVIDHMATPLLETFAAGIPAVLYWDPDRWEIRDQARPYFEALRRVGILWDAPEAAASQVERVIKDPAGWWETDELQTVLRTFSDRYALRQDNWLATWSRFLREEAAG